jgi:hypothetical protein
MKIIFRYILLICTLFTIYSCDNEPLEGFDLSNPATQNPTTGNPQSMSIVGTWRLTAWNSTNPVDINNDGVPSTNLLTEFNCYTNETIVFNSDNTGMIMSRSYAEIELELVTGTTNTYEYMTTCIQEIENTPMTWTQAGNIVAVDDGFSVVNLSLNTNQLSFLIPNGFQADSTDGMVTVEEDLTFVYTKQ